MSPNDITADKAIVAFPTNGLRSGALWLTVALTGSAAFFFLGWQSLFEAWSRPEYSHGYLIIPIAICLLLMRLGNAPLPAERDRWWVLSIAVVGLGLVVGLLGNLSGVPYLVTYGWIICIGGLVMSAAGVGSLRRLWVAVAYLVFMLPLPNFIYWPLSTKLQLISSRIGVDVISLFGVPAYLEGNVIDLGIYQLQVAEACSGLRYLFPLMSFAFLFAVLYRGPMWQKAILFLSAAPITVLMNSFRIGVIGILVDRFGIEQAEGFLHAFEGWIIFIACIAILYLEAMLLQLMVSNRQPIHRMLDIDARLLAKRFGQLRYLRATRALVIAALLIAVTGLAWQFAPAGASAFPLRTPLALYPTDIKEWRGTRETLQSYIEEVLGADDYLLANFTRGTEAPVNLFIAYYNTQTAGGGIHSPEVCIPGGGWEVSRWMRFDTGLQKADGQPLNVNRAIIQKGVDRQLVYYWFEQQGTAYVSDYVAKGYAVVNSITRGRSDGAIVRVITPIAETEDPEAADGRLTEFLSASLPTLPAFVPY